MTDQATIVQLCKTNRFAKILSSGYQFTGAASGPDILVAAPAALASAIFSRLLELPSLPWMSGTIRVVALDQLNHSCDPDETFDEILCLPVLNDGAVDEQTVRRALRTTLRLCAKLGMISGRGLGDPNQFADVA